MERELQEYLLLVSKEHWNTIPIKFLTYYIPLFPIENGKTNLSEEMEMQGKARHVS